jgi:hypothetical protein
LRSGLKSEVTGDSRAIGDRGGCWCCPDMGARGVLVRVLAYARRLDQSTERLTVTQAPQSVHLLAVSSGIRHEYQD